MACASFVTSQNSNIRIDLEDQIDSKILGEKRDLWIHLPNDGVLNPNENYPVVYILDGGVHMDPLSTIYENYWGHHLPKMILVGISNRSNRTRDLTPSKVTSRNGFPMNEDSGGAEKFTQFIAQELIPYIDDKYQTTPYRTLIGHSYGGLFAINTLVNHSDLFDNYIAIDPSLDWDDQKLLKEAKEKLGHAKYEKKSLYLSLAGPLSRSRDDLTLETVMDDHSEFSAFSRSVIEFTKTAETNVSGLNFSWKYYEHDLHGTVPLPSIIDGLLFNFNWYPLTGFGKFNDPSTPLDVLLDMVSERAKFLESHFGYPTPPADEEMLHMASQMYQQIGQNDKAEAFYKMNVEYYPKSINAFTALIEYYIGNGDKRNALKYLNIAAETFQTAEIQDKIRQIIASLGE